VEKFLEAKAFITTSEYFNEQHWKNLLAKRNYNTIIGVGGGTVLDMAKYLSFIYNLTYVAIPTAPTNDGIVSPMSVIFTEKIGRRTFKAKSPSIVIIDYSVLSSAPWALIASGIGDALAKIVSIKDWELARDELNEPYCKTAEYFLVRAIFLVLEAIASLNNSMKKSKECVINLINSLLSSGVAMMIVQSSRPAAGSEHLIGRHLELNFGVPHGIASAFGSIIAARAHELYNPSWWKENILSSSAIFSYCKQSKILSILRSYQVPTSKLIESIIIIIGRTYRPNRYTILHKINPTREIAIKLLEDTNLIHELA